MIEKVIEHIDELNQPHLKLLVMHDLMWALVEEWASSKAHAHRISNKDSDRDVQVMDAEAHDISQSLIDRALQPGQPMVCEYMRDKPPNPQHAMGDSIQRTQRISLPGLLGGL